MSKPPKIVIPGMNRGAGIPGGYILGRRRGSRQGPAELLNLVQVAALGIATTTTVTTSTSLVQSIAHSETVSLSSGISTVVSGSVSALTSQVTSLSSGVSTVISGSISTVNSRVDSLSTAIGSGGGGMHVLLHSVDMVAVASQGFDDTYITSAYKTYLLRWEEIVPSSTGILQVQVSPDNGLTWRTTNYFTSESLWGMDTNFSTYTNATLNSGFLLQRAGTVNAAVPAQGHMYLYGLADAALKKTVIGEGVLEANDNHFYRATYGGYYSVAEAINAIRIISVTGGVTLTGRLTLYGVSDTGGGAADSLSTAISTVDSNQNTSLSQVSSSLSGAISSTTSLSSGVSTVDSNQSTSLSQISSSLSGAISSTSSLSAAVGTVISGSISTVTSSVASLSTAVSTVDAGKANLTGGNSFTGNQTITGDGTGTALHVLNGDINIEAPWALGAGRNLFMRIQAAGEYSDIEFHDETGAATAIFFGGSSTDTNFYLDCHSFIVEDLTETHQYIYADVATVKLNAAAVTELTVTASGVDFRQAPTVAGVPLTNSLSTAISSVDSNQNTSLSQVSSSLSGAISSTSSLSSGVSTVDSNQSTSLSQISSSLSGAISSTSSLSTAGPIVHPGYVAGNWYSPIRGNALAAGIAVPANTIHLMPFTISKPITVSDLGARVTTLSGGGSFQLAIYANDAATGRPTGAALCSTGNISTAGTGALSATIGASVPLAPNTYWMAINQDNSTAVYQTILNTSFQLGFLIGSATLANVTGAGVASLKLTVAQTFGTWPNLTSASFSEATNQASAIVFLKAA